MIFLKSPKLALLALSLSIFITFSHSQAKQAQIISDVIRINDNFLNKTYEWFDLYVNKPHETKLELSAPAVVAGVLCFIASSVSSAGGIGGGGLFVPILTLVAGLDLRTASSLSAFMVTGGSVANVMYNLCIKSTKKFGGKSLIDYDIALLSEPSMLLGVSLGVICNLVFPEWLITILFAVFLAWSTSMSCKSGLVHWNMESEEMKMTESLENGVETEETIDLIEPLVEGTTQGNCMSRIPWMKVGVLVLVWCSFCIVYLLRGNRYGQGIISMETCGVGYWVLSSIQIPLAIVYTAWILCRKENLHASNQKDIEMPAKVGPSNKLVFPRMALFAGVLGGVFGIGGGMLISPLLLQVGIAPEVTAATCSFMVFFSSSMSAFQYLLLGMEHIDTALIFAIICFVASLLGLAVLQRAIKVYGRASLIVFSVSVVMALSAVLMTSFGALRVWSDYESGIYMGDFLLMHLPLIKAGDCIDIGHHSIKILVVPQLWRALVTLAFQQYLWPRLTPPDKTFFMPNKQALTIFWWRTLSSSSIVSSTYGRISSIIKDIQVLASSFTNIRFRHIFRETNVVADNLAKIGQGTDNINTRNSSLPSTVVHLQLKAYTRIGISLTLDKTQ